MKRHDLAALLGLLLWLAALLAFRAWVVEPRGWAAACVGAAPPWGCVPRAGLLWMQQVGLWGGAALAAGLASFLGAPLAPLAVALGIGGVANYNASFGMLGLVLGVWAWMRPAGK